jgi:hypothetical protein
MIRKVLALFTALIVCSPTALAFDGYVEVTNKTGFDIYYLYVSPGKAKTWEEDVLGKDVLKNGQTVRVTVNGAKSEYFDIRAEDEDGDTYTLWNVDISARDVTFTLGDLD